MSISFEHAVDVERPPEQVFALLNDVSQTPTWLEPCRKIERLTPEPNQVGSQFRYHYEESLFSGSMDGQMTIHIPNKRLTFAYEDSLLDLTADFRMSPTGMGTWLIHTVEVSPKSFFAKMSAHVIQSRLPDQVRKALASIKRLLESQ